MPKTTKASSGRLTKNKSDQGILAGKKNISFSK